MKYNDAPKLSLAEQKKKLKEKAQRAKDQEKREKDKERAERKAQEQKDRIFGLKNKHTSKHAQQFVQDVERNMKQLPGEQQKAEAKKRENDKRKAAEEQAQRELDEMMGLAIKQPKVPEGVDPKTIPCEFFKKGRCAKGWKCKFSHEKNTRKRTEKIDLFVDHRDDAEKEKDSDKMDDWDQDKLESVVKEKHSGENQNNKTDIVCKHFLEAVEKRLYGWFWVCPNGGNECKYRHALPSGYVLKSQLKAMMEEEKASQRTDEEILEEERAKIGEGVPVTQDTFAEWKRARDARWHSLRRTSSSGASMRVACLAASSARVAWWKAADTRRLVQWNTSSATRRQMTPLRRGQKRRPRETSRVCARCSRRLEAWKGATGPSGSRRVDRMTRMMIFRR